MIVDLAAGLMIVSSSGKKSSIAPKKALNMLVSAAAFFHVSRFFNSLPFCKASIIAQILFINLPYNVSSASAVQCTTIALLIDVDAFCVNIAKNAFSFGVFPVIAEQFTDAVTSRGNAFAADGL